MLALGCVESISISDEYLDSPCPAFPTEIQKGDLNSPYLAMRKRGEDVREGENEI